MSAVVGIDLSSFAIDLVKLQEETNHAGWKRVELAGRDAWERTLNLRDEFKEVTGGPRGDWWDDVYMVAIEAPYGRGRMGTTAILNRVVGAITASLPRELRATERCWIVKPDEWKNELGLKGKPTAVDIHVLAPDHLLAGGYNDAPLDVQQNARDAYCIAKYARDVNARAVAKALEGA